MRDMGKMRNQKEVFDLLKGEYNGSQEQKKYNFETEFFGHISGDYECECFDVPKETFIKIKGMKPDRFDKSWFNKGMYRIYLSDIMNMAYTDKQKQCIIKMKIEVEVLEKPISI